MVIELVPLFTALLVHICTVIVLVDPDENSCIAVIFSFKHQFRTLVIIS